MNRSKHMQNNDHILPLQGSRLALVPVEARDIDQVAAFFGDVSELYYYLPDVLLPRNRHQLDAMMKDWNDGVNNFAFACRLGDQTIGLVTLADLDPFSGNAELGIMLAAASFRKKGYAREAIGLILDYAFGELRLHRLYVRVAPKNHTSIRLFEAFGFQKEGRIRDAMRRGNGYVDLLLYGLLEDEYRQAKCSDDEFCLNGNKSYQGER